MPQNNPMQMLQQFNEFRQTMTPAGAKAKIDELLASGQMSKEQLESLEKQAQSVLSMIHR